MKAFALFWLFGIFAILVISLLPVAIFYIGWMIKDIVNEAIEMIKEFKYRRK